MIYDELFRGGVKQLHLGSTVQITCVKITKFNVFFFFFFSLVLVLYYTLYLWLTKIHFRSLLLIFRGPKQTIEYQFYLCLFWIDIYIFLPEQFKMCKQLCNNAYTGWSITAKYQILLWILSLLWSQWKMTIGEKCDKNAVSFKEHCGCVIMIIIYSFSKIETSFEKIKTLYSTHH